ncbi:MULTISPECIES: hypothetical protein [unclassified Imperialibacter]|nr:MULTISPECIES: hypothetical protein [unclassified Imperialibacter]
MRTRSHAGNMEDKISPLRYEMAVTDGSVPVIADLHIVHYN